MKEVTCVDAEAVGMRSRLTNSPPNSPTHRPLGTSFNNSPGAASVTR